MKKVIVTFVVFSTILTACKENKKEKIEVKEAVKVVKSTSLMNNVDTVHSVITWKGTKPTGAHNGVISLKNGSMLLKDGKLSGGEFVIDMNSITNIDMKGEKGAKGIENHLKDTDFFDAKIFPTSKFIITNVKDSVGKLMITGNLTIKDITKSIQIPATISTVDGITTFKSDAFKVDRTDFGITYKSKKLGAAIKDKFINDLMEISFVVKTKK